MRYTRIDYRVLQIIRFWNSFISLQIGIQVNQDLASILFGVDRLALVMKLTFWGITVIDTLVLQMIRVLLFTHFFTNCLPFFRVFSMLFGNYNLIDIISLLILWGISSSGRALALHVRGTGIDARILQQIVVFNFSLVSLWIALQAIEYLCEAWLVNLHEWVRVSLGAPFIWPCVTSKQKA